MKLQTSRREFLKSGLCAATGLPAMTDQRSAGGRIPIVLSPHASKLEELAAAELASHIKLIYSSQDFPVLKEEPRTGPCILLGTFQSFPILRRYVPPVHLSPAESFTVTTHREGGRTIAVVAGAEPRAVLYGVYALLEWLGYGFYLSYTARPMAANGPCRLDEWHLSDSPLVPERIVMDWHNFLSSCSTWNLDDWKTWIAQVARMRYNTVMVHLYGNNPIFTFTFNGQTKPVGYLSSTSKGRDWGTEHVNDVRRMIGAKGIFQGPVFGSRAALVPDSQRVAAVASLMQQAFAFAHDRGMNITFALDVDTYSGNPQNVIRTLPASARFTSPGHPDFFWDLKGQHGPFELANPETPEGYAYYKSQVTSLMGTYPEVTQIALWMRSAGGTLWRSLKPGNFPASWSSRYQKVLKEYPELRHDPEAPSVYAISKIVAAYRKALNELGLGRVELAVGGWGYSYVHACDYFLPEGVKILCQNDILEFDSKWTQEVTQIAGSHRKVIPIFFAQDDDHGFMGRPVFPVVNLASHLQKNRCSGFGIVHWTLRPKDIFFKNLSAQTWTQTKDEAVGRTCQQMAERTFGRVGSKAGTQYLIRWIYDSRRLGRVSLDRFLDYRLEEPPLVVAGCKSRLEILKRVREASHSRQADEQLDYFENLERFFIAFYQNHPMWQLSVDLAKRGDIALARKAIEQCNPKAVIDQYVRAVTKGKIKRGDMALIVSMNLRWLPYILSQRQSLGLEAIRYKFELTRQEELAQQPGAYTFYFDIRQRLWKSLGRKETGFGTFAWEGKASSSPVGDTEIYRSGITVDRPMTLRLKCIADQSLLPGIYQTELMLVDPYDGARRGYAFDLELSGSSKVHPTKDHIKFSERAGSKRILPLHYRMRIDEGYLQLTMRPLRGNIHLCGLVIQPEVGNA